MKAIFVIGAGRSGSTILSRVLNAHSGITFHGENDFLLPRLWNEVWGNRFWFYWTVKAHSNPTSALSSSENRIINLRGEIDIDIPPEQQEKALNQAAAAVRQALLLLLPVDKADAAVWGYKELWNGGRDFLYDWSVYDQVFPDALWVHLVRNPLTFAVSCSQWTKTSLDPEGLGKLLSQWTRIAEYSRRRQVTGRFLELRYEDLVAAPQDQIGRILRHLGVDWDPNCLQPLQSRVMRSEPDGIRSENAVLRRGLLAGLADDVPGFRALCESLGYTLDADIPGYFRSYAVTPAPSDWQYPTANLAEEPVLESVTALQAEHELTQARLHERSRILDQLALEIRQREAALQARTARIRQVEKELQEQAHTVKESAEAVAAPTTMPPRPLTPDGNQTGELDQSPDSARQANRAGQPAMRGPQPYPDAGKIENSGWTDSPVERQESKVSSLDEQLRELANEYESQVLEGQVAKEVGLCWSIRLPDLATVADTGDLPERSNLLLFEDAYPLGPAHALHQDIRQHGTGRYSHWGDTLFFSTLDGSDPNVNERTYTIVYAMARQRNPESPVTKNEP